MIISRTDKGDTIIDYEPEEPSLDDEAERNTAGDAPSIVQVTTRSSSDPVGSCGCAIVLRTWAKAGDGAASTLACFPLGACAGSALGLFNPGLILSTPAFDTDGIATLFCTAAFAGASAFEGAPVFGVALAFGMDLGWDGAAFDEAIFDSAAFDEAAPVPLDVVGGFRAVDF
jgi:hypothetical protein